MCFGYKVNSDIQQFGETILFIYQKSGNAIDKTFLMRVYWVKMVVQDEVNQVITFNFNLVNQLMICLRGGPQSFETCVLNLKISTFSLRFSLRCRLKM